MNSMRNIKKQDVKIFFVDTKESKAAREGTYIEPGLFKHLYWVEDEKYLANEMRSNLNPGEFFILFVHAWRNQNEYAPKLRKKLTTIKDQFGDKININIVTSDQPGTVYDQFQNYQVFTYDSISEQFDKIRIQEVSEIFTDMIKDAGSIDHSTFIFISHSSKNRAVVDLFYEKVLRLGLNVPSSAVFYTSNYETALPATSDIPIELRNALSRMTLFIQFISKDYRQSEVCLNEMGAAWFKFDRSRIITIKMPDVPFTEIGYINFTKIALRLDVESDMFRILDDYKDHFGSFKPLFGNFSLQLKSFIDELPRILSK
jgi:hypothetical protein